MSAAPALPHVTANVMHARNIAVRNCRFVVITSSIGDYVSKTVRNIVYVLLFVKCYCSNSHFGLKVRPT
jgi:hypothetical protein